MNHPASTSSFDNWEPRRVAVIGAGPMGVSLAAIVGQLFPVVIVCRSPERAADMVRRGVRCCGRIRAAANPIVVGSIHDLVAVGGVSVLFVATKTTAIPEVADELRRVLNRVGDQPGAPFAVSYQNGIEPGRQLMVMLADARVLRMVLNLGVRAQGQDGQIELTFNHPPHAIGCLEQAHVSVCRKIAELLSRAGLQTEYRPDIERCVWAKGVINAATNPVAALVNSAVGEVLNSPSRLIVQRLLTEGVQVAQAEGLDLGPDFIEHAWRVLEEAGSHVPSMVEDIRAGRESEVGQLNRQVIDHARRLGVPTPTHEVIDALIETFDWRTYASRNGHAPSPESDRREA